MKSFQLPAFLKKHYSLPHGNAAENLVESFSLTARVIFFALLGVFAISAVALFGKVNNQFLIPVPTQGGSYREGIVGLPRFINPILSVTSAGDDLTALIYSGLMKKTQAGDMVPDLAASYEISPDGRTYTFILKDEITFHDGRPVTADDVAFTITRAQDASLKSPRRAAWVGVEMEVLDPSRIQFTLKQSYPSFLENATIGILPKHIWNDLAGDEFTFSNYNTNPIGSGPYRIKEIATNTGGIPVSYKLVAFKQYAGGRPFIDSITMRFYSSEDKLLEAWQRGEVDAINSITPRHAKNIGNAGERIERATLPRVFGVFFNQDANPLFVNREVKEALLLATDRTAIIDDVLSGYGKPVMGPIPFDNEKGESITHAADNEAARKLLEKNGWKIGSDGIYEKTEKKQTTRLEFSLATSDIAELARTAELLKIQWQKIGVKVDVKIFEAGSLNQNIIRPRKYDALLFGEIINHDLDLYAFWHSSQ
ncbi:MAG TPA: peptide ABC transporter substrate-binding protein, partial [Candidatus Paceibacterota bacterium]